MSRTTEREQDLVVGGVATGGEGPRRYAKLHARARRVLSQLRDREHGYKDGWVSTPHIRGSDRDLLWHTLKSLVRRGYLERRGGPRSGHYEYHITTAGREALERHDATYRTSTD